MRMGEASEFVEEGGEVGDLGNGVVRFGVGVGGGLGVDSRGAEDLDGGHA